MPKKQRKIRHATPPKDEGTPELQQKRQLLLKEQGTQELALAESLLGVLYAHQMISKPLYEAGRCFGELGYRYEACLGYSFRQRTSPIVHVGGGSLGKTDSAHLDAQEEKHILAWRTALKALNEEGKTPYKTVIKVVFYDQDLYSDPFPSSILKELVPLRKGLERLDSHFNNF